MITAPFGFALADTQTLAAEISRNERRLAILTLPLADFLNLRDWLAEMRGELRACQMRDALNAAYCALTDDASCHLAYLAAGITQYDASDHERAVTYARLWRTRVENVRKQLRAAA